MSSEAERFLGISEEHKDTNSQQPEISFKKRLLIYLVTWIIALNIACPLGFPLLPVFPLGLIALFKLNNCGIDETSLIVFIWFAYLIHGIFILSAQTKKVFYRLLLFLIIVLILNISGCHPMLSKLSNIH